MATLAAQILIDWELTRAAKVGIDQSNPFDDDTAKNSTILTDHSELAADFVKSYLGSVTGTDTQAVRAGIRAMDLELNVARTGMTPELQEVENRLIAYLERLATARNQEAFAPVVYDVDGDIVED